MFKSQKRNTTTTNIFTKLVVHTHVFVFVKVMKFRFHFSSMGFFLFFNISFSIHVSCLWWLFAIYMMCFKVSGILTFFVCLHCQENDTIIISICIGAALMMSMVYQLQLSFYHHHFLFFLFSNKFKQNIPLRKIGSDYFVCVSCKITAKNLIWFYFVGIFLGRFFGKNIFLFKIFVSFV